MPQTRGKNPKSKKLSLQSVLRSKDKTDKSSNMDSNNPGYNINGDHAHAPSDNNPEFSQRSINEVTEETRAKSNISPNNLDSHKVISEGENFISSTNPQEDLALARSLYNQKLLEVQKLEAQEELVKLQNDIKKLDIRLNQNKVQQMPDYYDRDLQHKSEHFFDNYENSQNNTNNNFNDTLRAQRLSKKFKRLTVVRNPRDTINYFEEELYDENVISDLEKYNYLIGFWPREDISDYYKIIERGERNYNSLRNFCLHRDNELTEILDKIPTWETKTTFNQIFSTATKWAKCPEDDRIKFFLAYLMPSAIKSKMKEYYDADLDVFRRKSQAIWNAHKESALQTSQVNYNRLHKPVQNHYSFRKNYQGRFRAEPQQESYQGHNNTNNNYNHQNRNRNYANNNNSNQSYQNYRYNENRDRNDSNSFSRPYARANNQNRQQGNGSPSSRQ